MAIRKIMLAQAAAVVALGMLAFAPAAQAQKQGGSITVGLELDIAGFDPVKVGVYDTAGHMASSLIFDTLTRLDNDGKAQPRLATEWQVSEDFKKWTFKLRPNVTFHDGTPFNAQALKANIDRQKDPANKCRCAIYIANILSVDVVDDLTVTYTLRDPATMFPETLSLATSNNAVHSPTAWQAKGDDYNRNPVGTGPFVVKSWAAGDRMVLEKNPNYWDKGKPYLDRVVMRPLPDSQARFASLMAGESDIIWNDGYDHEFIKKARTDKNLTVHEYTGSGAAVAAFNTKVAPFDDVRVRQALVMAIDKQKMREVISGGLGLVATNPYGEGSWVKCKDDGALPFDPAKAKALLQEYGKPVKFKMLVTATPRGRTTGQILQQFWKQVGAEMELDQVDQATIPSACLPAQVRPDAVAHHRLPGPRPANVRQLPFRQHVGARRLSEPGTGRSAAEGPLDPRSRQAVGTLLRHLSHPQQGSDLVLDGAEHLLRDLEGQAEGLAENVLRRRSTSP